MSSQRSVWSRFLKIFKRKAHSAMDHIDDSSVEETLQETINDYRAKYQTTQDNIAKAIGAHRQNQAQYHEDVEKWEAIPDQIRLAIQSAEEFRANGNEDKGVIYDAYADELTREHISLQNSLVQRKSQIETSDINIRQLKIDLGQMRTALTEAERKKDSLVAASVSADAALTLREIKTGFSPDAIGNDFAQIESRLKDKQNLTAGLAELEMSSPSAMVKQLESDSAIAARRRAILDGDGSAPSLKLITNK